MNKIILTSLTLAFFSLFLSNCDGTEAPITDPQTNSFTLQKETFNQGEVALLITGATFESITLTLDNEVLPLDQSEVGYGFIIPANSVTGKNNITVVADDETADISITIIETENVNDPDQFINEEIDKINTQITNTAQVKSKLPIEQQASYQQDIDTIKSWIEKYNNAYNALSPSEKQSAAKTLAANRQNIDALTLAVDNLNLATIKLKKAEVENHEELVDEAMKEYTIAVVELARSTAIAGVLAGGGFLTFGPIGAAIGGGIGVGLVALKFKELSAAQSALMTNTFLPFKNMIAKWKKESIDFEENKYTEITIDANYRSVNSSDIHSSVPIATDFISTTIKVKKIWDDLMNKLSVNLSYNGGDVSSISNSREQLRVVHSNHLEIENISVPNITHKVDKSEGKLKLKFENTKDEDQEFTFDIVYTNSDFGSLRLTVAGKYIDVNEPLSGKWISQALSDEEADDTSDYKNYALIFNFTGINCKCLSIEEKNLNTDIIFNGAFGYCLQKDESDGKYYVTEPEADCPPSDSPDGELVLISASENKRVISVVDLVDGYSQSFTLTPYYD